MDEVNSKIANGCNGNYKELNFFGLLLKISKDLLLPSYNVIIHIHGGGFVSQSSESHLSYLIK